MATVCAASRTVSLSSLPSSSSQLSSSINLKFTAPLAVPTPQAQNGHMKITASSSSQLSRREAITTIAAGGAGLAGLLLLVSAGSAEARTAKPEARKKLKEALDKLKEGAVTIPEDIKKNVAKVAKK